MPVGSTDQDVVIIGAGVVGLACAAESVSRGYSTLVLERHDSFGQESSSRNSEVIHSGIYYKPGSLKARLIVRANRNLYAECPRRDVWINRCGKLVVALTPEEIPKLEEIHKRGLANGVEGLRMLDASEARALEPNITCIAALHVPSAGLLDSHELMRSYLTEARSGAAEVAYRESFSGAERTSGGYRVRVTGTGGQETKLTARFVVNAAGLSADKVASLFGVDVDAAGYRLHPNRGHYFRVAPAKSKLVSRLIYPVPLPKLVGIGIHITPDRAGQLKLGPDAEYIDPSLPERDWYRFDEGRKGKFYDAVKRYFPLLEPDDLSPDQVGVRAKIQKPGEESRDFIIAEESERGLPGLVNLVGIESPGLTCSREIAREAFSRIKY